MFNAQWLVLYSGKQYSISTTAGWSPFRRRFKTWLFVNPMVEMPSIWWMRSPGVRKSAAGPNVFSALIIGGYDKSKRSTRFTHENGEKWGEGRKENIRVGNIKNMHEKRCDPNLFLSRFLCIRQHFKHNNLVWRWMERVFFCSELNFDGFHSCFPFISFPSKVLLQFSAIFFPFLKIWRTKPNSLKYCSVSRGSDLIFTATHSF